MSISTPSDHVTQPGSIPGDFPPDPLLSTGSFISSPTPAADGALGSSATQPPVQGGSEAIGMSDQVNPSPANSESKSRKRSAPLDNSWLPPGWRVEDKVRASGATAGSVDKYYLEPITGRKFRSRTEVLYYLEHGTTPKKGSKKAKNTGSSSDHLEGKGRNKSSRKAKEPPALPPLKFDFENAPEKVSWCMGNAGEEAWTPFVGDGKVQDSVRRDWCTAFTVITTKNPSR
ncbi:BnaCnng34510D [Brassica napus]|uniref:BnaCnng34510D protein n=1 Tax=Brassica napus TaxID=3708 RepID=A0A078J521_BRANA|nr:BnaCnng34510D [Brassica napus]